MSETFSKHLFHWFEQHGRTDLPWQQSRDPYRIWVSEVMLQQTRVETVIPYFQRFIDKFPDVYTLANSHQDEVLGLWSGLGYYSRARNLHRAAQQLCDQHGGDMPKSRAEVEQLPGIGRSTAAAILSLAFDQPEAILDGNVKRVLCRFHGVEGWPGQSAVTRKLWGLAEALMPEQNCAAYSQAMMDLGATLCTPKQPACERCPVASDCVAKAEGRAGELPEPRPGRKLPLRKTCMVLLKNRSGEILLQRRPEQGIWGGLWSFPELDSADGWLEWGQAQWGIELRTPETWSPLNHTFTHFRLEIEPLYCELDDGHPAVEGEMEWVTLERLGGRGIATPVRRLIDKMEGREQ